MQSCSSVSTYTAVLVASVRICLQLDTDREENTTHLSQELQSDIQRGDMYIASEVLATSFTRLFGTTYSCGMLQVHTFLLKYFQTVLADQI